MKQVFLQQGKLILMEVPPPVCSSHNLLVANQCSLISPGTESSSIRQSSAGLWSKIWQQPQLIRQGLDSINKTGLQEIWERIREERQRLHTIGYCSAGIVLEVGRQVSGYQAGDRVACGGYGWASHAQIVSVPEKLAVKLPPEVDFRQGAFATLGSIALHAVHEAKAGLGEWVVVTGLGLVGLLVVQLLEAAGCQVIGIDLDSNRMALAQKLGLRYVLQPGDKIAQIMALTGGQGADAILVCASTASSEPLQQAAAMARRKGRVVVVGTVGMNISRDLFYHKELQLSVSCSYGPGRYDAQYEQLGRDYPYDYVRWTVNRNMAEFVRLTAQGRVKVEPLINFEYPLEEATEAYRRLMEDEVRPLAVLLRYPEKISPGPAKIQISLSPSLPIGGAFQPRPAGQECPAYRCPIGGEGSKKVINLALVGCGQIARGIHLPVIAGLPGYRLAAVVSRTALEAKACAEKYKARYYATDYAQVLGDADIDMVFICTRNNLHASQVIQAAKAGKNILVEKPLALSYEECSQVAQAVNEAEVQLAVGFNRHYAPLIQQIKRLLEQKSGPMLINYRVNAEAVPRSHWTLDPVQGGGRILGEACHFFELFNYLCGSQANYFSARAVPVDNQTVYALENTVAAIGYENGSLATLIYTSLGHSGLPKERLEIYRGNGVLVLDNYISLQAYGFGPQNEWKLKTADKGYTRQLEEFHKRLNGRENISLTLGDAIQATHCSLKIWECLTSNDKVFH